MATVDAPLPQLGLVVAVGRGGVIGKGGTLPWHVREDLRHFKRVTTGHAVVMGRRTYESIGRPLPNRRCIVVSRAPDLRIEGCDVTHSVDEAIALARTTDAMPMIIGGATVYAEALPQVTRIHLTEIDREVPGGDAFFPPIDRTVFRETKSHPGESEGVRFVTLERVPAGERANG